MKYEETLEFLYNSMPRFERVGAMAYKPGLERTLSLSAAFGNPHIGRFKVVHVAGTNGKGSTAHSLASVLAAAGYRTGLFTSPHLVDFRERIRINGDMISREAVVDFVDRYRTMGLDIEPSFFELTTILAFDWFARCGVDVAVVETGLGGRLDSTNIVDPELSVITNISLDHTALLGDTPAQIAFEKAGIIKPGRPVVIGEARGDVRRVFEHTAAERGSKIVFAQELMPLEFERRQFSIHYPATPFGAIEADLIGECQPLNMATILSALTLLQPLFQAITPSTVATGLADVAGRTGLMGRWTTIARNPRVIIDTAHNPGGWQYIVPQLNETAARRRHIVIGMAADKDIATVLEMMREIKDATFYFTAPSTPRAMNADALAALAREPGLTGEAIAGVPAAYRTAMAAATPDDLVFVGGSNFVIADLLDSLR